MDTTHYSTPSAGNLINSHHHSYALLLTELTLIIDVNTIAIAILSKLYESHGGAILLQKVEQ